MHAEREADIDLILVPSCSLLRIERRGELDTSSVKRLGIAHQVELGVGANKRNQEEKQCASATHGCKIKKPALAGFFHFFWSGSISGLRLWQGSPSLSCL